jgi:hypothetical protein
MKFEERPYIHGYDILDLHGLIDQSSIPGNLREQPCPGVFVEPGNRFIAGDIKGAGFLCHRPVFVLNPFRPAHKLCGDYYLIWVVMRRTHVLP